MQSIGCFVHAKVFWFKARSTHKSKWFLPRLRFANLTCGAGSTSLLLFLVNSDTPLVCRMAEGRSDSFFFLIFCLSFFRSWSSFSLYTEKHRGDQTHTLNYLQEEAWHELAHFLSSPSRCCWRSRLKFGSKGSYSSMDVS